MFLALPEAVQVYTAQTRTRKQPNRFTIAASEGRRAKSYEDPVEGEVSTVDACDDERRQGCEKAHVAECAQMAQHKKLDNDSDDGCEMEDEEEAEEGATVAVGVATCTPVATVASQPAEKRPRLSVDDIIVSMLGAPAAAEPTPVAPVPEEPVCARASWRNTYRATGNRPALPAQAPPAPPAPQALPALPALPAPTEPVRFSVDLTEPEARLPRVPSRDDDGWAASKVRVFCKQHASMNKYPYAMALSYGLGHTEDVSLSFSDYMRHAEWTGRKTYMYKAAILLALHPYLKPLEACRATYSTWNTAHAFQLHAMALHIRMHQFTQPILVEAWKLLPNGPNADIALLPLFMRKLVPAPVPLAPAPAVADSTIGSISKGITSSQTCGLPLPGGLDEIIRAPLPDRRPSVAAAPSTARPTENRHELGNSQKWVRLSEDFATLLHAGPKIVSRPPPPSPRPPPSRHSGHNRRNHHDYYEHRDHRDHRDRHDRSNCYDRRGRYDHRDSRPPLAWERRW